MCKIPTKAEIALQIKSLLDKTKTPEEVSDWACVYVFNNDLRISDEQIRFLLHALVECRVKAEEGDKYFEALLNKCEAGDWYKIPTKAEIALQIKSLLDKTKTPEEVSDWACVYTMDDNLFIKDENIKDLLGFLEVCHLKTEEGYLYGETDFEKWLKLCEE